MKKFIVFLISLLAFHGHITAWSLSSLFTSTAKPVDVTITVPAPVIGIKDSLVAAKDWINGNRLVTGLTIGSLALTAGNLWYLKRTLNQKTGSHQDTGNQKKTLTRIAKYVGITSASVGTLFLLSYFLRNYPTFISSRDFFLAQDSNQLSHFYKQPYTDLQKTCITFGSWIRELTLSTNTGLIGSAAVNVWMQLSMLDQLGNKDTFSVYHPNTAKQYKGFASVAGGVPEGITNLKDQLEHAEKYSKMGIPLPKGFLFHGPPGTGKTLLGRALAEELNMVFISVKATELESKWVGGSAAQVKNLYDLARSHVSEGKKVIIFIDEIDSIAPNRAMTGGGYHAQCLTQLLSEIDGLAQTRNIITIGTTNVPENIDPALLRSGRLEQHIEIPLPDANKRKAILEYYVARRPHTLDAATIETIANLIDGASGADIEELINRASVFAVRNGKEAVDSPELYDAIHKKWPNLKINTENAIDQLPEDITHNNQLLEASL